MPTVAEVNAKLTVTDEMSRAVQTATQRVADLQSQLRALGSTTAPQFEPLLAELRSAQLELKQAKTDAGEMGISLEDSGKKVAAAATEYDRFNTLATRLIERLGLLMIIRGTFQWITDLFEAAQKLESLNVQTDLSIGFLQQLGQVAESSGIKFEAIHSILTNFTTKLSEMKSATYDALSQLNLSISTLFAMSPDDRFKAIAIAINDLPSALDRAKYEAAIFGSDAIDPLIKKIAMLKDTTADTNKIMGDDTVHALANTLRMYQGLGDEVSAYAGKVIDAAQRIVEVMAEPVFGAGWERFITFMLTAGATGNLASALEMLANLDAAKGKGDIQLPSPAQDIKSSPLMGQDYVDMLWKQQQAVKGLTDAQVSELDQLDQLGKLTADNAAHLEVNTEQLKLYEAAKKAANEQDKEQTKLWNEFMNQTMKPFIAAWDELDSVAGGWRATVAALNPTLVEMIKHYLDAGATIKQVADAFQLQDDQVKAVNRSLTEEHKELAKEGVIFEQNTKLWEASIVEQTKASGTRWEGEIAAVWRDYDNFAAAAERKGTANAEFYDALYAKAASTLDALEAKRILSDTNSRASFQRRLQEAQDEYQFKISHADQFTQKDIAQSEQRMQQAQKEFNSWEQYADQAIDKVSGALERVNSSAQSATTAVYQFGRQVMATNQELSAFYDRIAATGQFGVPGAPGSYRIPASSSAVITAPSAIPRYARGTQNHPGGWAMVGDEGPELINMPAGSRVTPLSGMSGGSSTIIQNTFYVNGTGESVARAVMDRLNLIVSQQRKLGAS